MALDEARTRLREDDLDGDSSASRPPLATAPQTCRYGPAPGAGRCRVANGEGVQYPAAWGVRERRAKIDGVFGESRFVFSYKVVLRQDGPLFVAAGKADFGSFVKGYFAVRKLEGKAGETVSGEFSVAPFPGLWASGIFPTLESVPSKSLPPEPRTDAAHDWRTLIQAVLYATHPPL